MILTSSFQRDKTEQTLDILQFLWNNTTLFHLTLFSKQNPRHIYFMINLIYGCSSCALFRVFFRNAKIIDGEK